jgi:MFS family permease
VAAADAGAPGRPGAAPLLTRAFVLVSLANLTQALAFNLFLHFPAFLHDLGADDLQIGVIFGLTSAVAVLARPPVGRAMDVRGRRVVILVGGALHAVVCALYLTVSGMGPWIYLLRILHGVAEALLFTALFTYAADLVPARRRTEGIALFGVSGMLPIALGGILGDVILARAAFGAVFGLAAGLALVSFLLSLPLPERPRAPALVEASRGFRASLAQRNLLPLWWIGTLFALALASAFAFLKRFVDETGIGSVSGFFGAYAGMAVVMRLFFGRLPDRIGAKRVLFPALASLAAGYLVLAFAETPRDVVIAGALCGGGHGYTFPILFGMVVTRASEADRGSATAIFTALFDLGVVLGGPLFGGLALALGFSWAYAAAAAVVALGAVVFAVWDRRR